MVRNTTSAMHHDGYVDMNGQNGHTDGSLPCQREFSIPQRASSRAPSAADMDFLQSDSTIRDDEDAHVNGNGEVQDEDAMQTFGQRSRMLIKVIQKLEALGIDAALDSLPKFVVVGDQSHGKSSIVEAICGISMPRSAGTCTRCPFRITTTAVKDGEPWSCEISLSRRYACERGGRWVDTKNTENVPFATIMDRSELVAVLPLAQHAILNPHLDPQAILRGTAPTKTRGLSFSLNLIDIFISGLELPELSMIDLPGSINVAPNEDEQHLVKDLEKLIKAYIGDTQALILLVASIDQDLETSTAFRFVCNIKGLDRSMGVLTKADLLTRSRVEHVRQTLAGEKFRLGNRWFVTKNCSQEELDNNITHAEARRREDEFFCGGWWSTILGDYEARLGTKNLQDALSHCLVEHIKSELPVIITRVENRLNVVIEQLDSIPEQPVNPSQTVIEEMQKLIGAVLQQLQWNDGGNAFRTGLKGLIRSFRGQLQGMRPQVIMSTPGYVKPVLSVDSDDEDSSTDGPSPSKRQKGSNARPAATPARPSKAATPARATPGRASASTGQPTKAVFTLDNIHAALDQARTSDLTDQIHPKVTEGFIRKSIESWPTLTENLTESVHEHVSQMLKGCIEKELANRSHTALMEQVRKAVSSIHRDVNAEATKYIDYLVSCEMYRPISYAVDLKTTEIRSALHETRLTERLNEYYDIMHAENNAKMVSSLKRKDIAKDRNAVTQLLGQDKYATEVGAMASPLAYYDHAAARLTDTVANHLEYGVMHALEGKLQVRLMLDLKVTDQGYCAELLAEDPAREVERQNLMTEQRKLQEAMEELNGLPGKY